MNSVHNSPAFKLVLLGDSGVGKTSIVQFFDRQFFDPAFDSTIGASFVAHEIKTKNGIINFQIWDTAGQERYRSLIPTYSRGASCALIVFDQSTPITFQNVNQWLKYFLGFGNQNCLIYLVGNKSDLPCQIDKSQIEDWAGTHEIEFFSVSAKEGTGIIEMFQEIAEKIAPKTPGITKTFDQIPTSDGNTTERRGCC
jgi:small GTP-binding protein